MALRDALWLENAGPVYNAGDYRRLLDALIPAGAGVLGGTDLAVSEDSPTGMSVVVASGIGVVDGGEDTFQGLYLVVNEDEAAVAIAASDPTNPRIDLVGIRVRDSEYSGAADAADLFAVTGTPAGSPVAPTPPDNFLALAQIEVGAAVSTILDADITDLRTRTGPAQVVLCTSTTRPANPYRGLTIVETDTMEMLVYYGVTTGWAPPWNQPWGFIGQESFTADLDITTLVDIDSITFDQVEGRRYRVRWSGVFGLAVANDTAEIALTTSADANLRFARVSSTSASGAVGGTYFGVYDFDAASSASVTLKTRGRRAQGSSTVTLNGTGTGSQAALMQVEDIGPAIGVSAPSS